MFNKILKLSLLAIAFNIFALETKHNYLLITGGSGYIGSATSLYMLKKGYKVIVMDLKFPESSYFKDAKKIEPEGDFNIDFEESKNHGDILSNIIFIKSDYANKKILNQVFKNFKIEAVLHFAGSIEVGLSVRNPEAFYNNNVKKTLTLLKYMNKYNVKPIIFPSSAAVYGLPKTRSILEVHGKEPINPYGKTKNVIEMILQDYCNAYNFKVVVLRFFNAAGALVNFDLGERHEPETHLIPLLLKAAYESKPFYIFGNDYKTEDGSCVRDYLHIYDLARAHYSALQYLKKDGVTFEVFNLGIGKGYSVKEVVNTASRVTGLKINVIESSRRQGDPDYLVSDPTKAKEILHWEPKFSSLEHIILTAHEFHKPKVI